MKSQSTIGRKKFILHHYIYDLKAEQSTTRHLQSISILLAVLLLTVVVVPYYMDIRPVRAAPTDITTIDGLYAIRNALDGDYVLMNDLDFSNWEHYTGAGQAAKEAKRDENTSGTGWSPLGVASGTAFNGTFNGNGYTISNLFVNRSAVIYASFFGYIRDTNGVSNLTITNAKITGEDRAAIFTSTIWNATITNCHVHGNVTGGERVGGFVGYIYQSANIVGCTSNIYIYNASFNTGGFVGFVDDQDQNGGIFIMNCSSHGDIDIYGVKCGGFVGYSTYFVEYNRSYSTVNVTTSGSHVDGSVGGFIGYPVWAGNVINNSYATGNVSAPNAQYVGGFAGRLYHNRMTNCFSTGNVTGGDEVGGFIGAVTIGGSYYMANNYWNTETSGRASSGGVATGRTTAQMTNYAGNYPDAYDTWDFIDTWEAVSWNVGDWQGNAGYPSLRWQEPSSIETSFNLTGLTDDTVTWYGLRSESVWCNSSGTGNEILQILLTCNASTNVTNIDVYLDNLSYSGDHLSASYVTMYVSSNDNDYGSLGAFDDGGGNITINAASWETGTMGSDPFPVGPSESFTIYARFLLTIPAAGSPPDGTYVSSGFKVYISGNIF